MKDKIIAKLCEIAIHVGLAECKPTIDNVIKGLKKAGCNKCDELAAELSSLKAEAESKGTPITADQEHIKDVVLAERDKGNVVYAGFEGLSSIPLNDIIDQPADGLLYDLNRNESVVLTFINDPKWVNDFAVAQVIRKLHGMAFIEAEAEKEVTDADIQKAAEEFQNDTTTSFNQGMYSGYIFGAIDMRNGKTKPTETI